MKINQLQHFQKIFYSWLIMGSLGFKFEFQLRFSFWQGKGVIPTFWLTGCPEYKKETEPKEKKAPAAVAPPPPPKKS